jgi:hypothetical protein
MKVNKLIVFWCTLIFFAVLLIGASAEAGSLQATNTTKWTEVIRGFTTFASVVAACLAWAAQLVWSQQFRDAKEAEINALKTANQQLEGDIKSRKDDNKEFINTLKTNHRLAIEAKDEAIRSLERQIHSLESENLRTNEQNEEKIKNIKHVHCAEINVLKAQTSSVIIDHHRKLQEEFERIVKEQQLAIEELLRDRNDLFVTTNEKVTNISVRQKPPAISYEANEINRTTEVTTADNESTEKALGKILAISGELADKALEKSGHLTTGLLTNAFEALGLTDTNITR